MAEPRKLVLRSIETAEGDRCVDIFRRDDCSYGFEGYRRDAEDGRGWYPITGFGELRFAGEAEAMDAARKHFPWIADD
jgi:hypothetical protein